MSAIVTAGERVVGEKRMIGSVLIWGAGAIGGAVGAYLARAESR